MDMHLELSDNVKQYLHFIHDNVYMNILICLITAVLSRLMYNYHVRWKKEEFKPRVRIGPQIYHPEYFMEHYFIIILFASISVFYFFKIIIFK